MELLERAGELAELEALVESGRGRLVLIAGEAGIGKTSLVRALRDRLAGRATFLIGACEPLSVPVPLAPLRELAGDLAGADSLALARSLLEVLRAPAVAVLEDAHWADPATLDVLRLLARRVEDAGVVVLVTYRDDELAAHPALAMLVGDLATSPAATRMALAPLSPAAVRELADPAGVDPAELTRLTGGNPFLVAEALAARGGLPPSLRDATMARVGRLGPDARGVVDAAAVIGQRVPPDLLASIVPGTDAVEEALAHGVLTDDGAALGFRHELTRQAIEDAISAPRRAELNARVVAALEQHAPEHARLAHHAERAGLAADATRYAALAAADAERVGALREAALQLERALRLSPELPAAERLDLLLRFSRAANFSGRMEPALDAAEEAVALARRRPDARARTQRAGRGPVVVRPRRGGARRRNRGDRGARADRRPRRARARPRRVRARGGGGVRPGGRDRRRRAGARARRCVRAPRRRASTRPSASRSRTATAASRPGTRPRATIAAAAGLHIQVVRSYVNELAAAADARDHATVDALAPQAVASFEERGLATPAEYISVLQARSLFDRGRWDEAIERAEASRRGWHGGVSLAHMVDGLVAARRGQDGGARLAEAGAVLADVPEGARHGAHPGGARRSSHGWAATSRPCASTRWRGCARPTREQFARSGRRARAVGRAGLGELGRRRRRLAPAPVRLELAGDWRGAIAAWRELLSAVRGRARRAPRRRPRGAGGRRGAAPARRDRRRARVRPRPRRAGRGGAARAAALHPHQPRRPHAPRAGGAGARRRRAIPTPASPERCTSPSAPSSTTSPRSSGSSSSATRTAAVQTAREAGLLPNLGGPPAKDG